MIQLSPVLPTKDAHKQPIHSLNIYNCPYKLFLTLVLCILCKLSHPSITGFSVILYHGLHVYVLSVFM